HCPKWISEKQLKIARPPPSSSCLGAAEPPALVGPSESPREPPIQGSNLSARRSPPLARRKGQGGRGGHRRHPSREVHAEGEIPVGRGRAARRRVRLLRRGVW